MSDVAVICASCPEGIQDRVTQICQAHKIQKAYGKSGDMVDSLKGKDWVAKWQSKVVAASVTKAVTMSTSRIKLICIQGGKFCNEEFAHTKTLKSAIEQEWKDGGNTGKALIDIQWMDVEVFFQDYALPSKSTGKAVKEDGKVAANESGKSNKSGAGKGPAVTADTRPAGKSGEKGPHTPAVPTAAKGQPHHAERNSDKPAPNEGKKGQSANNAPSLKKGGAEDAKEHKGPGGANHSNSKRDAPPDKGKPGVAREREKEKEKVKAIEFSCDECDKEFKNKESLAQHLSSTNHYTLQMMCKGCQKTFKDRLGLKQHQQATGHYGVGKEKIRERNIEVEIHTCGECEREFLSEKAWEAHQEATGHVDPECEVCAKVFSSPRALEQHLEATGHWSIGANPLDFQAQLRLAVEAHYRAWKLHSSEVRTEHRAPACESVPVSEPAPDLVPPAVQPSPANPITAEDSPRPESKYPESMHTELLCEMLPSPPICATPASVLAIAVDGYSPKIVVAEPELAPAPPAKETEIVTAVPAPVSAAKARKSVPVFEPVSEPVSEPLPAGPIIVSSVPTVDPSPPVSTSREPIRTVLSSEVLPSPSICATPAPVVAVAVDGPAPSMVVAEALPVPPAKETEITTAVPALVSAAKARESVPVFEPVPELVLPAVQPSPASPIIVPRVPTPDPSAPVLSYPESMRMERLASAVPAPVSAAKAPPPTTAVPPVSPAPAPFVDGPCKCTSSFMFPHRKSKCAFGMK